MNLLAGTTDDVKTWRMIRRPLLFTVGVSLSGCGLVTCGHQSTQAGPIDAGPDTAIRYIDRWTSDAADVGVCAPPGDDAGVVHDWPGFRRMSEIDPCCPFDVAQDLSVAAPYKWIPCGDAGGCQQLDIPFVANGEAPVLFASVTRSVSGLSKLYLRREYLPGPSSETTVYDLASGSVDGLWRYSDAPDNSRCIVELVGSVNDEAVLLANLWPTPIEPTTLNVVARGTAKSLASSSVAAHPLLNSGVYLTNLGYSSTQRLALDYQSPGYQMLTCDLSADAATPCVAANLLSVMPAKLLFEFIEGDTIFAKSNSGTTGWGQEYVIDAMGKVALFRSRPNAHVFGTCSDGKSLAWTETYGSVNPLDPQTLTEVWSAPFTSDPAVLANTAKKIAVLPNASMSDDVKCFNGYYAWARNDLYVVRLSDGALVTATSSWPPKFRDHGLLYVTSTEVWDEAEGPMGDAGAIGNAIMRFKLPAWP
jgi:hypothetical protein